MVAICILICFVSALPGCSKVQGTEKTTSTITDAFAQETYPDNEAFLSGSEFQIASASSQVNVVGIAALVDCVAVLASDMDSSGSLKYNLLFYSSDNTLIDSVVLNDKFSAPNLQITGISSSGDKIAVLASSYDPATEKVLTRIYKLDSAGNIENNPQPLTFSDSSYSPIKLFYLTTGEVILSGYSDKGMTSYVYDEKDQVKGSIYGNDLTGDFIESDGDTYAVGTHASTPCMYKVDLKTLDLSNRFDLPSDVASLVFSSSIGVLYGANSEGIFKISLQSGTMKKLMTWTDTNIQGTQYSYISPFCVVSDDCICIQSATGDPETGLVNAILLKRESQNPNIGKTTLVMAGFEIDGDPVLMERVQSFNNSNTKYKIVLRDYWTGIDFTLSQEEIEKEMKERRQQLVLDVLSGDGPDLIYTKWSDVVEANPLAEYEANGALLDMMPLIKADSNFSINDYLPNVIEAATNDGKLCKMPIHFLIQSLDSSSSYTKGITGWTPKSFTDIADSLPSGVKMIANQTKTDLLKNALSNWTVGGYYDRDSDTAHFDTVEFCSLLKWANTFGQNESGSEDEEQLYKSGQLVLRSYDITSSAQVYSAYCQKIYHGIPDVIGYPSDGSMTGYVYPFENIAITAGCKAPEGAWEVVKSFLTLEYQRDSSGDFTSGAIPIRKDALDACVKEAMNPTKKDDGGETSDVICMSVEERDAFLKTVNSVNTLYYLDLPIWAIIQDEIGMYFAGQRSAEDTAAVIQSRVQLLVDERN